MVRLLELRKRRMALFGTLCAVHRRANRCENQRYHPAAFFCNYYEVVIRHSAPLGINQHRGHRLRILLCIELFRAGGRAAIGAARIVQSDRSRRSLRPLGHDPCRRALGRQNPGRQTELIRAIASTGRQTDRWAVDSRLNSSRPTQINHRAASQRCRVHRAVLASGGPDKLQTACRIENCQIRWPRPPTTARNCPTRSKLFDRLDKNHTVGKLNNQRFSGRAAKAFQTACCENRRQAWREAR